MDEGVKPSPDELGIEIEKRTKESEIGANIKFWQELGVEVDEADVRKEIETIPEVEGYDLFIYIPKDLSFFDVLMKMHKIEEGVSPSPQREEMKVESIKEISERWSGESPINRFDTGYAVAMRHTQNPEPESFVADDQWGKINKLTPRELRSTGADFINPLEYIIARIRWFKENQSHMDIEEYTMCPDTLLKSDKDPDYLNSATFSYKDFGNGFGSLVHNGIDPDVRVHDHGIRKVVTRNTSTEIIEKCYQEIEESN